MKICSVKEARHKGYIYVYIKGYIHKSFHLYEVSRISKFIRPESRLEVPRGWRDGGTGFLWGVMKMF